MATYNFKDEAEVYLDFNNTLTRLFVTSDLSFSQTFTDSTYSQKTLHEQHKMHEASNIKKANPANFEFTIPAITNNELLVVKDLLVDYKTGTNTLNTFTLIIKVGNNTYMLYDCVITNGTFIIEKLENLKLTISGQASKLAYDDYGAAYYNIRTHLASNVNSGPTLTYQSIKHLSVSIGTTNLSTQGGLYSVSAELQNDIEWIPYENVTDALSVTNAATSMYPSNFTLKKRVLSGSIGQYVNSDTDGLLQEWQTGVSIVIKAGESATQGFQFDLSNCTFTNRNNVADVFTQAYDWKMNDNPTDLGSKIKFNNT